MNAIILVNKSKGVTSRDVVNSLTKTFNTKKIGHTGTLDPIAAGVLIICIGKYTKLVDLLTSKDKEYIATFKLGIKTDTYDITGKVLEENNKKIDLEDLKKIINKFPKTYLQEVPIYSAIKIKGKKLYEYARNNEKIVLPKREVNIYSLELLNYQDNLVTIKAKVSKGTYIRSLITDICSKLNTIGAMTDLIRIGQGDFKIENSYTLEEINNHHYETVSLDELLKDYEKRIVDEETLAKIKNGNLIPYDFKDLLVILNQNKEYIVIYKQYEKDQKLAKPYIWLN